MKLSLSTNWCNRHMESGEEIAEKAIELGFDELELGFHTTVAQVPGFKRMLNRIPVGSIHAFCPVPLSAPCGYPELYQLANLNDDARAIARIQVERNIEFAADIGADTVVLHAGRVHFNTFFSREFDSHTLRDRLAKAKGDLTDKKYCKLLAKASCRRTKRGERLLDAFMTTVEGLLPVLEKRGITLAFENLPYLEGFPNESEMVTIRERFGDAPVRAWFDTGHHRVREMHGWLPEGWTMPDASSGFYRGMHLNDVIDFHDDHLAPGDGKVDFAALGELAKNVRHIVFEPSAAVGEPELKAGIARIRALPSWNDISAADGLA